MNDILKTDPETNLNRGYDFKNSLPPVEEDELNVEETGRKEEIKDAE